MTAYGPDHTHVPDPADVPRADPDLIARLRADLQALNYTVEAVESLLAEGFEPGREVHLWFGGDEETGSEAATAAAALFRERGLTPWLVLAFMALVVVLMCFSPSYRVAVVIGPIWLAVLLIAYQLTVRRKNAGADETPGTTQA